MRMLLNMGKVLLYIGVSAGVLVIASIILMSKPLPPGVEGPEAEEFADALFAVVNGAEWSRLRYVTWTYSGHRHYIWDKWYQLADIRYDDVRCVFHLNTMEGLVWKSGVQLEGEARRKELVRAWAHWCNDSFWLNPLVKLRDEGTIRRLVTLRDGRHGLLVTYTSGGVTPGDSFLWTVGEDGLPDAWRMWVRILPVKGVKATWEGWVQSGGVWFSTRHRIGPRTITIDNLRTGRHYSDIGLDEDPF